VIRFKNGETLDSGEIVRIRGHAYDPMNVDELWEKFADCTARTHTQAEAKRLFEMLQSVDELKSVLDLPTCEKVFT
jgi:hypothetical protein